MSGFAEDCENDVRLKLASLLGRSENDRALADLMLALKMWVEVIAAAEVTK